MKASRKAFSVETLGSKTWCNKCRRSLLVKSWNCPCGRKWFGCEVHKDKAEEAPKKPQEEKPPRDKRRKRKRGKAPVEADLEELFSTRVSLAKTARATGGTVPVIRKRMLSANLKRKFGHSLND